MKLIDRYFLAEFLGRLTAFLIVVLMALLLERLLRTFDLALGSDDTLLHIALMLLNLTPHYLGVALPLVTFLALLLTVNRLSREGELVILQNAGLGFQRLVLPVIGVTTVLAAALFITVSDIQPQSRYSFRAVLHDMANASPAASTKAGTFFRVEDHVFLAEKRLQPGYQFEGIFLFADKGAGRSTVTTSEYGVLQKNLSGTESILTLRDGEQTMFPSLETSPQQLQFDQFAIHFASNDPSAFRARGKDTREFTLEELVVAKKLPPKPLTKARIDAEIHHRLTQVATMLLLPLLAFPLGLSGGRRSQVSGIALGLVGLIAYQKVLNVGKSLVAAETLPAWLGLWGPFVLFMAVALYLFIPLINKIHQPPFQGFFEAVADAGLRVVNRFRRRPMPGPTS